MAVALGSGAVDVAVGGTAVGLGVAVPLGAKPPAPAVGVAVDVPLAGPLAGPPTVTVASAQAPWASLTRTVSTTLATDPAW